MISFSNSFMFWGLLEVPVWVFLLVLFLRWKKKSMLKFATAQLQHTMFPQFSKGKIIAKHILFIISYALLIIVLARPRMGMKVQEVKTEGADIVIALDVSNSMLAEDLKPNRLERAKQAISVLLDQLKGDRIGLVVFAGTARKQIPITIDYATAKMTVQTISPDDVNTQGTSLSAALEMAINTLPEERKGSGAIILISDGEDHEGQALEIAQHAKEKQIYIHTVGIGSPQGVPIPVYENGQLKGYKTDKNNQTVITKLNEAMLQQLAAAGGGIYVKGNNPTAALDQIKKEIDRMEKQVVAMKRHEDGEDRFQWILIFAILLLGIEIMLGEKASGLMNRIDMFTPKQTQIKTKMNKPTTTYLSSLLFMLMLLHVNPVEGQGLFGNNSRPTLRKGNQEYKKGNFDEAIHLYQKALSKDPKNPIGHFNLGNTYYKKSAFDSAMFHYQAAIQELKNDDLKSKGYYNLGNSMLQKREFQKAIDAYKEALKANPNNEDARYNLSYALKMLKQQQQQQQQQNQNQDQQNKDQQQNQPQQNNEEKKNDDKKEQPNQPQEQKNQMSREEAERILNALKNREKELKNQQKDKGKGNGSTEKDW